MNRREFLAGGAGALALGAAGCRTGGAACCADAGKNGVPFRLGVAGITLSKFKFEPALAELKKWDVTWFCAKDFHFPLKASAAELKSLVARAADSGVRLYAAGPVYICSEDEAKRTFDYAAALGVPTLVGVPAELDPGAKSAWSGGKSSRKMCELCAKLADEYRIDFAIHNHGANPKTGNPRLYPTVASTMALIRDLSPRIGLCVDVAYTRADGYDPSEVLRAHAPRVFDVHLRNTAIVGNGSSGAAADRGVIDYVKVLRTLCDIGYDRVCGLELGNAYAKPSDVNPGADPTWVPRSIGYFRGVMDALAS